MKKTWARANCVCFSTLKDMYILHGVYQIYVLGFESAKTFGVSYCIDL